VIDSVDSADSINKKLEAALSSGTVFSLSDEKGRTVVVPAASIAYVDIAASEVRKVGFGA
jgi:hypothetical protein